MWPRILELLTALWLIAGPYVLPGLEEGRVWSMSLGAAVVLFTLLTFTRSFRYAHVATFALSLFMIVWPMTRPMPISAVLQNVEICGWLLAMFAVIPTHSNRVPESWRTMIDARERQGMEGRGEA